MIKIREDDSEVIVRLVLSVRWGLYLFLILPKLIISVSLLLLGSMWLTATEDFADLILNAVALEFIILVDEVIFDAMFPVALKKHLEGVKLWVHLDFDKQREVLKGLMR